MNDQIISDIRTRGHWLVVIRAAEYRTDRIAFEDLQPTLERSTVSMRGWNVPHINSRGNVKQAADHIFQSSSFQHHLEHWRFYQSGQFIQLAGMGEDWRDQSDLYPQARADWKPGEQIGITDTLWRYTELLELARRLSVTAAGDDPMFVSITATGLLDRRLSVDESKRMPLFPDCIASINEFKIERTIDRVVLIGEAPEIALDLAFNFFLRFNWTPNRDSLREVQTELLNLK